MQEVALLFTRYSDIFGRIVGLLTGGGFSHVSVSPDLGSGVFYSFNIKGFAVERPLAHSPRRRLKGSLLLRLEVDGESHERLMRALGRYLDERESHTRTRGSGSWRASPAFATGDPLRGSAPSSSPRS